MTLKLLQWNPMSLVQAGREQEISERFKQFPICVLVGTQIRAMQGRQIFERDLEQHKAVHFGYGRGGLTNKSCGISIMLHKRWFRAPQIATRWCAGERNAAIRGRGGAVRLRSGRFDITVIGIYIAPRPSRAEPKAKWIRQVDAVCEWIEWLLTQLPARTTPMLALDLNDGLGRPATTD